MTLRETLAAARERLVAAGVAPDEAAIDVSLFARVILGWDRARLITESEAPAPAALEPSFSAWVARRAAHEPAAYITGIREFYGLDMETSPAALVPRPETEFIIEAALPLLRAMPRARVADIGTGTGNIAVTLAHEVPDIGVVATDVSAGALALASRNTARHGVSGRVHLVRTSMLDGVAGPFDLIASNPPYVRELDRRGLSLVVRHEPEVALFGGASGLEAIARVLDVTQDKLAPGGWLIMEFGLGQEDEVRALTAARPWLRIDRMIPDLQGIPRTAVIQKGL